MTEREIDILINHTMCEIYDTCLKNKLTEAQSDYFVNSIIYQLGLGQRNDSYKKMEAEESKD